MLPVTIHLEEQHLPRRRLTWYSLPFARRRSVCIREWLWNWSGGMWTKHITRPLKNQIHLVQDTGLTEDMLVYLWEFWSSSGFCGPASLPLSAGGCLRCAALSRHLMCRKQEVRVSTEPKIDHADLKILDIMLISQEGTENGTNLHTNSNKGSNVSISTARNVKMSYHVFGSVFLFLRVGLGLVTMLRVSFLPFKVKNK